MNLGIDARKSDQGVRGATTLPHGTGSDVACRRISPKARTLKKPKPQGQILWVWKSLPSEIKGGMMNFDVVVASPDAMRIVGQLGQVSGASRSYAESQDRHSDARHRGRG